LGKGLCAVELFGRRPYLLFCEVADGAANEPVIVVEVEVHDP
jgi:hypothetical protein